VTLCLPEISSGQVDGMFALMQDVEVQRAAPNPADGIE